MDSWELIATLGTTLAAWGTMLWLMWRMQNSVRKDLAINERTLVRLSGELAEFRGEMRGDLKGVNTALLVLREDFRAHVHGVRAG